MLTVTHETKTLDGVHCVVIQDRLYLSGYLGDFYKGQAQDRFAVLSLHARVKVPYTSSDVALLTKEWTPLEPGVLDHKLSVRGIGTVLEQTVKGGAEREALVSLKRGP